MLLFKQTTTVLGAPATNGQVKISSATPSSTVPAPGELYRVTGEHRPTNKMDLAARYGDVVEVIKKRDPMGNDNKWYCRLRGQEGFLPKEILTQCEAVINGQYAMGNPGRPAVRTRAEQSNSAAVPSVASVLTDVHVAVYNFVPAGPHQLQLNVGDRVAVVTKHDLDGNSEWWYVSRCRDAARGYVPALYLKQNFGR